MFLCRILSIFFLFYSVAWGSVTDKNMSQENIGINEEKICLPGAISKLESRLNDAGNALTISGEGIDGSNGTLSDDSIFDDDRYGHVIEKFINEMEVFWQGVKSLIADENKSKISGNWWHGDTEHKYNKMKEQFYEKVPKELPQKVKDIIDEYEMRYNDLMWSEVENIIINQGNQENISNAVPTSVADTNTNEKTDEHKTEAIKDSIDNKRCKKRSFEDVFQVKLTKSSSFTAI